MLPAATAYAMAVTRNEQDNRERERMWALLSRQIGAQARAGMLYWRVIVPVKPCMMHSGLTVQLNELNLFDKDKIRATLTMNGYWIVTETSDTCEEGCNNAKNEGEGKPRCDHLGAGTDQRHLFVLCYMPKQTPPPTSSTITNDKISPRSVLVFGDDK